MVWMIYGIYHFLLLMWMDDVDDSAFYFLRVHAHGALGISWFETR